MALAILSVPKEKLRDEGGCEINTAHIYQMAKNDTRRMSEPDGPSLFYFIRFYKKKNNKSLVELASFALTPGSRQTPISISCKGAGTSKITTNRQKKENDRSEGILHRADVC